MRWPWTTSTQLTWNDPTSPFRVHFQVSSGHKKHLCEIWKAEVNQQPFFNALKGTRNYNSSGTLVICWLTSLTWAARRQLRLPLGILPSFLEPWATCVELSDQGVGGRHGSPFVPVDSSLSLLFSPSFSAFLPDCWPDWPTVTSGLIPRPRLQPCYRVPLQRGDGSHPTDRSEAKTEDATHEPRECENTAVCSLWDFLGRAG